MTLPRQVVPGRDYMITRRCSERRFFLRPDDETNNAFIYCLVLAATRANVQVTFAAAMSNHALCAAAHNACYGQRLVMWSRGATRGKFPRFQ
jgi:REP element-mobilizing transposase RayT